MSESAESYGRIVVQLSPRWRVIECQSGIQWVLQYRRSAETCSTSRWQGRSFCRTRSALIRFSREHAGAVDQVAAAILAALPDRLEFSSVTASTQEPATPGVAQ